MGSTVALAAVMAEPAVAVMSDRDRAFLTELVQGTTRMRRSLDHVGGPFIKRSLDPPVEAAVRMGTYQLVFLGTPPHAAVGETVASVPKRYRGFINAVLRRVAEAVAAGIEWPSDAVRMSYPDWLVESAVADWGDEAIPMLAAMNIPERPPPRPDGYVQGQASRWVTEELDAAAPDGGLVIDLCAAPGGKLTGFGPQWSRRVGCELSATRVLTLSDTARRFWPGAQVVRSDATSPPFRERCADAVLADAPCSGLGALGRGADARWHATPEAIERLAGLQLEILEAAERLVRPGGHLVYSVCTFALGETLGVMERLIDLDLGLEPRPLEGEHWRPLGPGGIVLPHDQGTDAMAMGVFTKL